MNGFKLEKLSLKNFRNYENYYFDDFKGVNIFCGKNAIGKTNIIEAIQLITQGSSFRMAQTCELVNNTNSDKITKVEAQVFDQNLDCKHNIKLVIKDNKKTFSINEKNKTVGSLKGSFPSVVFSPEDLSLVKGSNTKRRDTIDSIGSQISKDYYTVLKDYNKALKQKNKMLKDEADISLVESINSILTITGAQLTYYRYSLVKKIAPIISDIYTEVSDSNEDLQIEYFASWDAENPLQNLSRDDARTFLSEAFNEHLYEEQKSKRSLVGPHRDKIVFLLNKYNAQAYASQGQQRTIALSLKLAEVQIIKDSLDKTPILLMDDVMSELDQTRQNKLIKYIDALPQVFITATNAESLGSGLNLENSIINL